VRRAGGLRWSHRVRMAFSGCHEGWGRPSVGLLRQCEDMAVGCARLHRALAACFCSQVVSEAAVAAMLTRQPTPQLEVHSLVSSFEVRLLH
jgi:hypothetical protein